MKKHLIYLGYTGTSHRIALFDENSIVTRSVPVKDVQVLSDDLEFLNCTVIDGVPYPNLKGAKVICTSPRKQKGSIDFYDRTLSAEDLWAFEGQEPEYLYRFRPPNKFSADELLSAFYSFNIWDGFCKENYFYVIGEIYYHKNPDTCVTTRSKLCITSTGSLLYLTNNAVRVLDKAGAVFVQVGTPDLFYTPLGQKKGTPTVGLPVDVANKVIWVSKQGKHDTELMRQAEYVWWSGGSKTTIMDLRRYPNARVFGVTSCAEDASVVIFPESTEEIWYSMFYECTSLKAVYIPDNVQVINEFGLPPRRFNNVTLYSDSPLVAEFCERSKVAYKPCSDAEEMLKEFYSPQDKDYISVEDASSIASLGGNVSVKLGESGTLWSAILFSYADKGQADEVLQERYPVVPTCDYAIPSRGVVKSVNGNISGEGLYSKERCRTLAGALTQFYPLYEGTYDESVQTNIYKFRLADYNLYVVKDVLERDKIVKKSSSETRSSYVNYHVALLEDIKTRRIIHRFLCNETLFAILCTVEGMCVLDNAPSGVLRYADKLPDTPTRFNYYTGPRSSKNVEGKQFATELFNTFLPIKHGTKTAKYRLAGIDLHTGNLVTFDYSYIYQDAYFGHPARLTTLDLELVDVVKNIRNYPEGEQVLKWFDKDCLYYKNK